MGLFSWLLGKHNKYQVIAHIQGTGEYSLEIVGESQYQKALGKLLVARRRMCITRKLMRYSSIRITIHTTIKRSLPLLLAKLSATWIENWLGNFVSGWQKQVQPERQPYARHL